MSISNFQEKFVKGGCGTAVIVTCAAIFFAGMFYNCGRAQGINGSDESGQGSVHNVATIGNVPVSVDLVQNSVDALTQEAMRGSAPGMPPPVLSIGEQADLEASGLARTMNTLAMVYMLDQSGVPSDEALIAAQRDASKEQIRQALQSTGQVKPTASDQEIEAAAKKLLGKPMQDLLDESTNSLKADLKDASKRKEWVLRLAGPLLLDAAKKKIAATDEDVRKSFDTYDVKRILLTGEGAEARAQKVLGELKSGLGFEAAMDKYSKDSPEPKKRVSETVLHLPASSFNVLAEYRFLKGKTTGYVSDVVKLPEGAAIYKVVGIKNDLPKDFATNKARYQNAYVEALAASQVGQQLKELMSSSVVKFQSPGYKALWDYTLAKMAPPSEIETKLREVTDEAKAAVAKNEGYDAKAATYARYASFNALWNQSPAKHDALRDERIEVLNTVLQSAEDISLRLELASLYAEKKDGSNALIQLMAAVKGNTNYDVYGEVAFRQIGQRGLDLVKQGLIKEADLKDLNAEQAKWRDAKADYDKSVADAKRAEAEARRQEEENRKKNEEDIKKQKEEAKKAGGTATGSLAPPTPGGATGSLAPPATGGAATGSLVPPPGK